MPIMHFNVRWPDESRTRCYSPSLVIKDYFQPATTYPLPQFVAKVSEALHIASDRVAAKYGFACSAAMDQLAQIEAIARRFEDQPAATVEVLTFEENG
jgi:uncharacterized repeat protein (TIGR04042 family)